ncbi:MAG: hypothetical protein ABJG41_13210 [Cyclobacteriaceae bacterium]
MSVLKHSSFPLLFFYVLLIGVIAFRVCVHPTHYTTPDSIAYLKQSEQIKNTLSGELTPTTGYNITSGFTLWPTGYPLCIALTSILTKTSVLVSSKIVNLVFLGLILLILYHWFGNKAWFTVLPFFSYGSLEVISETWSETPFIFFVFLLCFILTRDRVYRPVHIGAAVALCLVGLFLFRYVGLIYFVPVAVIAARDFLNGRKKRAYGYFVGLAVSAIFVGLYLYNNKLSSNFFTGGERIFWGQESFSELLILLGQGLLNEFSIARDHVFSAGWPDHLFVIMLVLQFLVIGILVKNRKHLKIPLAAQRHVKMLLILSVGYLIAIVPLRMLMPFDNFDFRILFPFTLPFFIALFGLVVGCTQKEYFDRIRRAITVFMFLSLGVNLPKKYIVSNIKNVLTTEAKMIKPQESFEERSETATLTTSGK